MLIAEYFSVFRIFADIWGCAHATMVFTSLLLTKGSQRHVQTMVLLLLTKGRRSNRYMHSMFGDLPIASDSSDASEKDSSSI